VKQQPKRRPAAKAASGSKRIFYLALAIVAVAGIGTLSWLSSRQPQAAMMPVDTTLPKVASNGYVIGSPSAPVEVIEFGDFECPTCGHWSQITEPDVRSRLVDGGVIRMRFIDYPLPMHRNTWQASRAAACADEQGKFWPMHDLIFQNQDQWNGEATRNPDGIFKGYAKQLGLNQQQFDQCVDSKKYQAKIQAHEQIAVQRNVGGTPTFVIGGQMYSQALTFDQFKKLVDDQLAKSGSPMATPASGGTAAATKAPTKAATAPAKR